MNRERLKRDVERIKKHREEKAAVAKSEREIFAALKADEGIKPKALRRLLAIEDMKDRVEIEDAMMEYRAALGMACEMVSNGDLSLRQAAKAAGVSKSSIHRALAVPAVSHDLETGELPRDMVDGDLGEVERGAPIALRGDDALAEVTTAPALSPPPAVWHFITVPVLEQLAAEEAERAEKEAARIRKAAERLALAERNRAIDADPLDFPPFLKARALRCPHDPRSRMGGHQLHSALGGCCSYRSVR